MADEPNPTGNLGFQDAINSAQQKISALTRDMDTLAKSAADFAKSMGEASRHMSSMSATKVRTHGSAPVGAGNTGVGTHTGANNGPPGSQQQGGGTGTGEAFAMSAGWAAAANVGLGVFNVGIGAFNDLRVGTETASNYADARYRAFAGGGVQYERFQGMLNSVTTKYNVLDTEQFISDFGYIQQRNWGALYGYGSQGQEQAAQAMAGTYSMARSAGLAADTVVPAMQSLQGPNAFYTGLASGVFTHNPVTGDAYSPVQIANQFFSTRMPGATRDQIQEQFQYGSQGWAELMGIVGGDENAYQMIYQGLLDRAEYGQEITEENYSDAMKALGRNETSYTEYMDSVTNLNQSEVGKIGEYADSTLKGAATVNDAIAGINRWMTEIEGPLKSMLETGHTLGGAYDAVATEMPETLSAVKDLLGDIKVAVLAIGAGMLARSLLGGGGGGGLLGGLGRGASGMAGKGALGMLGRGGLAIGAVAGTEALVNWMQPDHPEEDWSQLDSAGTIAARAGGYAAGGAAIGGPFGALAGAILGLGVGTYDAWQNEQRSDNKGIANFIAHMPSGLGAALQLSNHLFGYKEEDESQSRPEGNNFEYDEDGNYTQPSHSEGSWFIPEEQNAKLHYGEMVLPNRIAQAVRDELNVGRAHAQPYKVGGGNNVTIHVHIARATDSEAVRFANMVKKSLEVDDRLQAIGSGELIGAVR